MKPKTKTTDEPATLAPKQIIDVARPGSLPPANATARPVIVSNRAIMQDPMMAPASATKPAPAAPENPATTRITLQPLDEEPAPEQPVPVETTETAKPTPVAAKETDDIPVDDESAKPAEEGDAPDLDKQAAALEADAKAQDELDQLVDQKTYFLPINAGGHRRSKHVFIFGTLVIILLVLAWLNIALDAGFITIPGINPVTHLFSN